MRLQEEARSVSRFVFTGQVAPSPAWEPGHLEKEEDKHQQTHCCSWGLYSLQTGEGSGESQPN